VILVLVIRDTILTAARAGELSIFSQLLSTNYAGVIIRLALIPTSTL
jgi:hypothetical protein